MPHPTSSYLVCSPSTKMACHARCLLTGVLPNENDGIQLLTSSDHACCPRDMLANHAQGRPIV